jgi:hypothetical protein
MKQLLARWTILVASSLSPTLDELTAAKPIDIGGWLELFVDAHLIDLVVGTSERRLNWPTGRKDAFTCYAKSKDGIHWTRTELGIVEFNGSKTNNIIMSGEADNTFVPFTDSNRHCKPEEQYKVLAGREIEKDLPIAEHPSYKFVPIAETRFMTNRDGLHFRRWGKAFIRPGSRRERWIHAGTFPTYGLLVTKANTSGAPDELSLYVNDGGRWSQRGKARRFRRYTMRIDGFVSVNAPLSGGELVTKPLTFTGSKLAMNFGTSAAGSVRVEFQNEAGKPIRQRFVLKDAGLYSIQFRP